jgi:ABC-type branched-subunit amino acid transport system ATPase component
LIGLFWLAVAVTFGVRRPGGAWLAGLAFTGTPMIFKWIGDFGWIGGDVKELITSSYFVPILFGLGAINLAKNPDGLLALIGHQRLERRLTRERDAEIAAAETALRGQPAESEAEPTVAVSASAGSDAVLVLEDVRAGYGEFDVLHDLSIGVPSGKAVALLGANGAGKSTLCAVAAGLLTPTHGRVLLGGNEVTAMPAFERAREGVLLVPEARGIFPGLTVEENLKVLLRTEDQRDAAYERFPILGERRGQAAGLLSGGEQQMLSLAPALAEPPKVFIADEPTLGLAPLAAEIVIEAIREIREKGSAVLLVEEKAREVMELADTVVFMELGRIIWAGPREEADAEQLAAAYLGSTTL